MIAVTLTLTLAAMNASPAMHPLPAPVSSTQVSLTATAPDVSRAKAHSGKGEGKTHSAPTHSVRCAEDDSQCWNPCTMGNGTVGRRGLTYNVRRWWGTDRGYAEIETVQGSRCTVRVLGGTPHIVGAPETGWHPKGK